MYADFHLHSSFSGDCNTPPEDVVTNAIEQGLSYMCITDHRDLDFPKVHYAKRRFDEIDYNEYFAVWNELKEKYKKQIDIRIGIEAGIEPSTAQRQRECVNAFPFDFVINSAHIMDRRFSIFQDFYDCYGTVKGIDLYFRRILENIKCFPEFDVVGHIDFLARFSPEPEKYKYADHVEILDEILKSVLDMGKGIEINTAGYRRELKAPNPSPDILKRYKELGGTIITMGSDAHRTTEVGYNIKVVADLLKSIGFEYYCIFKNHEPEFIKL